jgi:Zn-dependent protease with chaperone function
MDEQTLREVLIHEQAHVCGWHTLAANTSC